MSIDIIAIKARIKEVENMIHNHELDFLKYSKKYHDKLKIKYANRAFEAEKKLEQAKNKLKLLNEIKDKYES